MKDKRSLSGRKGEMGSHFEEKLENQDMCSTKASTQWDVLVKI